ncbi:hypothetical protein ACF06P_19680 [Streptomyces sp. NPDC015684]|uniref:hypothetical protein n=1 Tax=Streptomyces sp. NPDC015684 TaxID=3364963 RepID=UPI0036FFC742
MRTIRETKAVTSAVTKNRSKCEYCGRAVGANSCRPVERGWWCMQRYLIPDETTYINPEPDPIGKLEQAAIDRYADALEAARTEAAEWDEQFEKAKSLWLEAVHAHRQAPLPQTVFRRGVPEVIGSKVNATRLAERERQAREDLDLIETNWLKARQILGHLERRADRARTIARLQDRGQC